MDSLKQFQNVEKLIGNTPLLEIIFTYKGDKRRIFAKAEHYNLTGSIKDRVAYYILRKAYEHGTIRPRPQAATPASRFRRLEGIWDTRS